MKISFMCFFIISLMCTCTPGHNSSKIMLTELWKSTNDLKVPESVMYDKRRNVLYVANINGKPLEKNGKGFISQFSSDGKLLKLLWVSDLHAPKGMGIANDTLYVTNIDEVVAIDIPKAKIRHRFKAKNAQFLNDIAIASNGTVFISDMTAHRIYALANNSITVFIQFSQALYPNGLDISGGQLFIGTTKGIYKCDINSKQYSLIIKGTSGIDGLKHITDTKFLTSDWEGRVRLEQKGSSVLLLDTTKQSMQAADFEYIPEKQLLIVPTFFADRIVAYKFVPAIK